jgi:hypothetical protein
MSEPPVMLRSNDAPAPWQSQRHYCRMAVRLFQPCASWRTSHVPSRRAFLSAYGPIAQHFRPRGHLLSALAYRQEMHNRFASWAEITGTKRAA